MSTLCPACNSDNWDGMHCENCGYAGDEEERDYIHSQRKETAMFADIVERYAIIEEEKGPLIEYAKGGGARGQAASRRPDGI